jgi:uncharacterized Zn finger protein (UPF0148 family)
VAIDKCNHPYFHIVEGRLLCSECGTVAEKKKCPTCGHESTLVANRVEDKSISLQDNKSKNAQQGQSAKA